MRKWLAGLAVGGSLLLTGCNEGGDTAIVVEKFYEEAVVTSTHTDDADWVLILENDGELVRKEVSKRFWSGAAIGEYVYFRSGL